jgi:hypothetical protein
MIRLRVGRPEFGSRQGQWRGLFPSQPRPDRLWDPPSLLSNGYLGTPSPGVKWPGHENDHLPPSRAKVKNAWNYTSTPQYVFMTSYLVKHRDNFILTSTLYPTTSAAESASLNNLRISHPYWSIQRSNKDRPCFTQRSAEASFSGVCTFKSYYGQAPQAEYHVMAYFYTHHRI